MNVVVSRVFVNGNSQAVRIPQEFRLDASQVEISRTREGHLLIRPLPLDRGAALLQALEGFDDALADEFTARLADDRHGQATAQERDAL
jgi:antitoxin VapB